MISWCSRRSPPQQSPGLRFASFALCQRLQNSFSTPGSKVYCEEYLVWWNESVVATLVYWSEGVKRVTLAKLGVCEQTDTQWWPASKLVLRYNTHYTGGHWPSETTWHNHTHSRTIGGRRKGRVAWLVGSALPERDWDYKYFVSWMKLQYLHLLYIFSSYQMLQFLKGDEDYSILKDLSNTKLNLEVKY